MKAKLVKESLISESRWNHDMPGMYGGSGGSFSRYTDGVQHVTFFIDRGEWMYEAEVSSSDKAPGYAMETIRGEVPDEFAWAFNEGTESVMTKFAKTILK